MKKSEETKARILEKAIDIVSKKGYSASTTKEIATGAGVSEAALFKYFSSKDELLKHIVLEVLQEFHDYSLNEAIPNVFNKNKNKNLSVIIKEIVKERCSFFEDNSSAIKIIFQELLINEAVRDIFKEKVWIKMVEVTDTLFDAAKSNNEIKDYDNNLLRKAFFGLVLFPIVFYEIFNLDDQNNTFKSREVEQLLDVLFNGIKEE